jgi:hypothetical protein
VISTDAAWLGTEAARRLAQSGQFEIGPGLNGAEITRIEREHNAFWHPSWGQRPADGSTALSAARRHLAQAPTMIPVYAHRYLPAGRGTYGHPVLSIYQTDIVVYGTDLADYIDREFGISGRSISPDWTPPPMVPFWSEFL